MTIQRHLLAITGGILATFALPATTLPSTASAAVLKVGVRDANATEVERFFMQGIAHFNRHDIEPFLRQFHDDIRMFAVSNWLHGKPALRERFQSTFTHFPKTRMEITNLRARSETKDVVTVEFEFHIYPQGTGAAWHGVGSGVYVKTSSGWREVLEHESVTRRDK
jgi:uncharacterized protein (TIGR02246 family)